MEENDIDMFIEASAKTGLNAKKVNIFLCKLFSI